MSSYVPSCHFFKKTQIPLLASCWNQTFHITHIYPKPNKITIPISPNTLSYIIPHHIQPLESLITRNCCVHFIPLAEAERERRPAILSASRCANKPKQSASPCSIGSRRPLFVPRQRFRAVKKFGVRFVTSLGPRAVNERWFTTFPAIWRAQTGQATVYKSQPAYEPNIIAPNKVGSQ